MNWKKCWHNYWVETKNCVDCMPVITIPINRNCERKFDNIWNLKKNDASKIGKLSVADKKQGNKGYALNNRVLETWFA